jgi:hypothetical protein
MKSKLELIDHITNSQMLKNVKYNWYENRFVMS